MFIDIHDLERDTLEFAEEFPAERIDLGKDVALAGLLVAEGFAERIDTEIHLRGHLRTAVDVACARCLEATRRTVDRDFDLYYRPIRSIAREEEVEVDYEELEIGFYHGNGLLLEEALAEQVLLELPMKSLCRPDCRGLCLQCGQNLNLAPCDCRPPERESRWAALEQFKK